MGCLKINKQTTESQLKIAHKASREDKCEQGWYSVDPLVLYDPVKEVEAYLDGQHNGGVFNSGNLASYSYTYGNPIIYVDPNGKQAIPETIKGKKKITIRLNIQAVNPNDNITQKEITNYTKEVGDILSKNDLEVKVVNVKEASINLELHRDAWFDDDGDYIGGNAGAIGDTQGKSKEPIQSRLNSRSGAHEIGHRLGLEHPWSSDQVDNTEKNRCNLLNSYGNPQKDLRATDGSDLTSKQTKIMWDTTNKQYNSKNSSNESESN